MWQVALDARTHAVRVALFACCRIVAPPRAAGGRACAEPAPRAACQVTVTSYNEWGEGTQIEPARPHVGGNGARRREDRVGLTPASRWPYAGRTSALCLASVVRHARQHLAALESLNAAVASGALRLRADELVSVRDGWWRWDGTPTPRPHRDHDRGSRAGAGAVAAAATDGRAPRAVSLGCAGVAHGVRRGALADNGACCSRRIRRVCGRHP